MCKDFFKEASAIHTFGFLYARFSIFVCIWKLIVQFRNANPILVVTIIRENCLFVDFSSFLWTFEDIHTKMEINDSTAEMDNH